MKKDMKFSENFFSGKWSYELAECIFRRPAEILLAEGPEFFAQCRKMIEKRIFPKKNFPSNRSIEQVESSFDYSTGNIPTKGQQFVLNKRKSWWKLTMFEKNVNFFRKFFYTRWMFFWQPRRNILTKAEKF